MIIVGHFCVAKSGLPMRPIYQQNYPSFEGKDEVKRALMPTVTQGFDSGVLEHVCRRHCMRPQVVLATGSATKVSALWYWSVAACQPVNVNAFAWLVKYITVADMC